jgi:hypothetical protein
MSQNERAQLEQCMEHLAFVLDKLGMKEVRFMNGMVTMDTHEQPINYKLMSNFCSHISSLYKEEMVEDTENIDPDVYFSV